MKHPVIIIALAVAGIVLTYGLVRGQAPETPFKMIEAGNPAAVSTPAPVQVMAQVPPPASGAPLQTVDETALRYFARQGDTKRVDAEIARLRALYPDWEPPQNLLTEDYVPDAAIEAIWDLYSAGDFAGARAAIAAKQSSDPSFQPSDDLLANLALGEAGLKLRNASDAGQFATVISVAANMPGLLTCDYVDNLWRLAEAFIKTDATQRGIDAYNYVLANCQPAEERFATVQKASVLLDRATLEPLLAQEKTGADGIGEFAPLRLELARTAIGNVLAGTASSVPDGDLQLLDASARASKAPDDLRLLGWYALNRKRPAEGRDWFEMAQAADPSLLSSHGLGVALLDLGRPGEAEAVLAPYRDENADLTALYLTAAASMLAQEPRVDLDADVLDRVVELAVAEQDAKTAQELGWYAYAFEQPQTAIAWFKMALGWNADDEASAYGLLVASDAIKDTATVNAIKAQWGARSDRIARFGDGAATTTTPAVPTSVASTDPPPARQAAQQTASAQPATSARSSGSGCSSFVPPESLSPGNALTRAWCLMELNRPTDAVANFARALQSSSERTRSDAAYGQSLAYIRLGLVNDAAVAAAAAPITSAQALQLQVDIQTQAALRAYEIGDYRKALIALDERGRYAPEQNDLLTLRAWSYYHLRRYRESEQIFEAVAATGYGPAVEGLNAVKLIRSITN